MCYFNYNVILILIFVVRMESMEIDPVPSPMRKVSGFCVYMVLYIYGYKHIYAFDFSYSVNTAKK